MKNKTELNFKDIFLGSENDRASCSGTGSYLQTELISVEDEILSLLDPKMYKCSIMLSCLRSACFSSFHSAYTPSQSLRYHYLLKRGMDEGMTEGRGVWC